MINPNHEFNDLCSGNTGGALEATLVYPVLGAGVDLSPRAAAVPVSPEEWRGGGGGICNVAVCQQEQTGDSAQGRPVSPGSILRGQVTSCAQPGLLGGTATVSCPGVHVTASWWPSDTRQQRWAGTALPARVRGGRHTVNSVLLVCGSVCFRKLVFSNVCVSLLAVSQGLFSAPRVTRVPWPRAPFVVKTSTRIRVRW